MQTKPVQNPDGQAFEEGEANGILKILKARKLYRFTILYLIVVLLLLNLAFSVFMFVKLDERVTIDVKEDPESENLVKVGLEPIFQSLFNQINTLAQNQGIIAEQLNLINTSITKIPMEGE